MTFPGLAHAFLEALPSVEEELRKIDAGEITATPERRAFLADAVKAWKLTRGTESGGLPVDGGQGPCAGCQVTAAGQGSGGGRPQNDGLAEPQIRGR